MWTETRCERSSSSSSTVASAVASWSQLLFLLLHSLPAVNVTKDIKSMQMKCLSIGFLHGSGFFSMLFKHWLNWRSRISTTARCSCWIGFPRLKQYIVLATDIVAPPMQSSACIPSLSPHTRIRAFVFCSTEVSKQSTHTQNSDVHNKDVLLHMRRVSWRHVLVFFPLIG